MADRFEDIKFRVPSDIESQDRRYMMRLAICHILYTYGSIPEWGYLLLKEQAEGRELTQPFQNIIESSLIWHDELDSTVKILRMQGKNIIYRPGADGEKRGRYILVGDETGVYDPVAYAPVERPLKNTVEFDAHSENGHPTYDCNCGLRSCYVVPDNAERGILIVSPVGKTLWEKVGWRSAGRRVHAAILPDNIPTEEWSADIKVVTVAKHRVRETAQEIAREIWESEKYVYEVAR